MSENIYTALHQVYSSVGYVQKKGKNQAQNYRYAGEADLIEALRPELVRAGIVFFCTDIRDQETREIRKTNNGRESVTLNYAANFVYTFVHAPSGSSVQVMARGEGSDNLDKAGYKAMTGALKYALRQTMLIETGNDPDRDEDRFHPPVNDGARSAANVVKDSKPMIEEEFGLANAAPPSEGGKLVLALIRETQNVIKHAPSMSAEDLDDARAWLKEPAGADLPRRWEVLGQNDRVLRDELVAALGNRDRVLNPPEPAKAPATPETPTLPQGDPTEIVDRLLAEQEQRHLDAEPEGDEDELLSGKPLSPQDYQRLVTNAQILLKSLPTDDAPGVRAARNWLRARVGRGTETRWKALNHFRKEVALELAEAIGKRADELGFDVKGAA